MGVGSLGASIHPQWFHPRGFAIRLDRVTPLSRSFVLRADRALLDIERRVLTKERGWHAEWRIEYPDEGRTHGIVWMTDRDLRQAFGLLDEPDVESGDPHAGSNGRPGDTFERPGRFCRQGPYLSIPCRGTGADGDPNFSVYVTGEIRGAVRQLLE